MKKIFGDFDVMVKQCLVFCGLMLLALLLFGCNNKVATSEIIYYQAYDGKWDDPTINPIFLTKAEAQEYADRNNIGSELSKDTSHQYIVREINYRYEIRQINDWMNDVLHTTNCKQDGVKYVQEFSSAHSDLFMYDLKTGDLVINSTP